MVRQSTIDGVEYPAYSQWDIDFSYRTPPYVTFRFFKNYEVVGWEVKNFKKSHKK
jgi:hypothetical protein